MVYKSHNIKLSRFDLQKQLTDLKKEVTWLNEVNSQSLRMPLMHLETAYKRFFTGRSAFPRFKTKNSLQSFTCPQNVRIEGNKVTIPKFKEGIKIVRHRNINGLIKQGTITKSASGKYFISVMIDTGEENPAKKTLNRSTTIGLDLGIKSFLVTSQGQEYKNPRYLKKSLSKLKFIQRKCSKYKGNRTKQKFALLHEKVANQRNDFLHKVSSDIINNHDNIAIENLLVKNMVKNHCLAQSIIDCGWGNFVKMLQYKSEWYGNNVLKIGTFEPSSKTCSCCGDVNHNLTLKDRAWTCIKCGTILDRDVNAAINIKNFALKNLSVGRRLKNRNELPTIVGVKTSEALF